MVERPEVTPDTAARCPECGSLIPRDGWRSPAAPPLAVAENGQRADFTDSHGLPRYKSRFGFNAYGTADDARRSWRLGGRKPPPRLYVWRLADGLYDVTVTPDPTGMVWYPAELVEEADLV